MNKAEFLKQVKEIDFDELKSENRTIYSKLRTFTQAIAPKLVGKDLAPDDKKPHEGEMPVKVKKDLDILFKHLKEKYPRVFKTKKEAEKTPLEKKLKGFKSALIFATGKDKEILESKIKGFESAIKISKMQFGKGGNVDKDLEKIYIYHFLDNNSDYIDTRQKVHFNKWKKARLNKLGNIALDKKIYTGDKGEILNKADFYANRMKY